MVLIGNGRLYGGSYRVFPEADLHDGLLEVCVFPRVDWWTIARCAPSLLLQGRVPPAFTQTFRAASVTLSGAGAEPVEVDGELIGHLPATFSVEQSRLRVLAGA
jgi:diacylglycerol kinase family enzyme